MSPLGSGVACYTLSYPEALYIVPGTQQALNKSNHFPIWASLVAQMVKKVPATQETWVRSLGQEDPLEEGMATHSSIRAWKSS